MDGQGPGEKVKVKVKAKAGRHHQDMDFGHCIHNCRFRHGLFVLLWVKFHAFLGRLGTGSESGAAIGCHSPYADEADMRADRDPAALPETVPTPCQ